MSDYHKPNGKRAYKKLYLDKQNAKISGVCAGIADYIGLDPILVRIATVLLFLLGGGPLILIGYIILAFVLDAAPRDLYRTEEEGEFWKNVRVKPHNTVRDIRHKFRDIERRMRAAEAHMTSSSYKLRKEFDDLEGKTP